MSENLAEIVHPLVENGLFGNAEIAVKNLMADYVLRQIEHYRSIVQRLENKYSMNYAEFNRYLEERAKRLSENSADHKNFMLEEEDALDWKIATEMLESWLGLQHENSVHTAEP